MLDCVNVVITAYHASFPSSLSLLHKDTQTIPPPHPNIPPTHVPTYLHLHTYPQTTHPHPITTTYMYLYYPLSHISLPTHSPPPPHTHLLPTHIHPLPPHTYTSSPTHSPPPYPHTLTSSPHTIHTLQPTYSVNSIKRVLNISAKLATNFSVDTAMFNPSIVAMMSA